MRIRKIEFKDHPILGDLSLDLIDPMSNAAFETVVIAGENGTGKTAILQGIFQMLSSIRHSSPALEIELADGDLSRFRTYYDAANLTPRNGLGRLQPYERPEGSMVLPYFEFEIEDGTKVHRPFDSGDSAASLPTRCLFSEAHLGYENVIIQNFGPVELGNLDGPAKAGANLGREISQLLVDLTAADNETVAKWVDENPGQIVPDMVKRRRISRFDEAIRYMFPRKRIGNLVRNGREVTATFVEQEKTLSLNSMSSGEKQILFRGGFLLRHASAASGAVILVDEPELGLHPDWQAKIVEFYRKLVPDDSAETTQLIFATHSPFIVHDRINTKVIVLSKDGSGRVRVEPDPVYATTHRARVAQALNVSWLVENSPKEVFVLVEGETDQRILETAWSKLEGGRICPYEFRAVHSKSLIRTILNQKNTFAKNKKKLVGLFDFDSAYDDWLGTWNKDGIEEEVDEAAGLRKRHATEHAWAMLLPVPDRRKMLANSELGGESRMSIEFLFDGAENEKGLIRQKTIVGGGSIPVISKTNKVTFSERIASYPTGDFVHFKPIFDALEEIHQRKPAARA